jgi:hypothetical protein
MPFQQNFKVTDVNTVLRELDSLRHRLLTKPLGFNPRQAAIELDRIADKLEVAALGEKTLRDRQATVTTGPDWQREQWLKRTTWNG